MHYVQNVIYHYGYKGVREFDIFLKICSTM